MSKFFNIDQFSKKLKKRLKKTAKLLAKKDKINDEKLIKAEEKIYALAYMLYHEFMKNRSVFSSKQSFYLIYLNKIKGYDMVAQKVCYDNNVHSESFREHYASFVSVRNPSFRINLPLTSYKNKYETESAIIDEELFRQLATRFTIYVEPS